MIFKGAISYRTFNSGGKGGQHGNRSMNAIEAALSASVAADLDIPVITATATLKSQHASKRAARRLLLAKIRAHLSLQGARGRYSAGKERVRTYHEPDNRVVDSSGLRWSWDATVGKGDLAPCIDGRRREMAE